MKIEEKRKAFEKASCDFNRAKDDLNRAVGILEEAGLDKDANTLFNMILKIEKFQNKYNEYSLYNR